MTHLDVQTGKTTKGMLWAGRILSALPVLFMVLAIVYALTHLPAVQTDFSKYGYSEHAFTWILATEILCLILYLLPRTNVLGAVLLTGYLGGAVATHVRVGESFVLPVLVGIFLWLGIYFRDARLRVLLPFNRCGY